MGSSAARRSGRGRTRPNRERRSLPAPGQEGGPLGLGHVEPRHDQHGSHARAVTNVRTTVERRSAVLLPRSTAAPRLVPLAVLALLLGGACYRSLPAPSGWPSWCCSWPGSACCRGRCWHRPRALRLVVLVLLVVLGASISCNDNCFHLFYRTRDGGMRHALVRPLLAYGLLFGRRGLGRTTARCRSRGGVPVRVAAGRAAGADVRVADLVPAGR